MEKIVVSLELNALDFDNDLSLVRTFVIPVKSDDKQVRISPIPSGIVGQPTNFTSKFI